MDERVPRIKFIWMEGFVKPLVYWGALLLSWVYILAMVVPFMLAGAVFAVLLLYIGLPDLFVRESTPNQDRQISTLLATSGLALTVTLPILQVRPKPLLILVLGVITLALISAFLSIVFSDWPSDLPTRLDSVEGVKREALFVGASVGCLIAAVLSIKFGIYLLRNEARPPKWLRYTTRKCALCYRWKWVLRFTLTGGKEANGPPLRLDAVCMRCRKNQRKTKRKNLTHGEVLVAASVVALVLFFYIPGARFLAAAKNVHVANYGVVALGILGALVILLGISNVAFLTAQADKLFLFVIRWYLAAKDWWRRQSARPPQ